MRPISVVIGTRNEVGLVDRDCELTEAKWRPNRASWIWLILSNFITRPHRDLGVDGRGWWAWYHGLDIERLRSRFVLYQSKSSLGWISRSRVLFFIQYFINIFLKYYYSQNLVFGGEFGRFSPLFRLFRPIIVDHGRVLRAIPPGKLSELFQYDNQNLLAAWEKKPVQLGAPEKSTVSPLISSTPGQTKCLLFTWHRGFNSNYVQFRLKITTKELHCY